MDKKPPLLIPEIIPPRPDSLKDIQLEMSKEDPDLDQVCSIIKRDVAFFSIVMSVINSARFALPTKITSIERAISLLGAKRSLHLIKIAALRKSLNKMGPMERFWDSASEVGSICAYLAKNYVPQVKPDDAYTLGMLHDIGIPIMMMGLKGYKALLGGLSGRSLTDISAAENSAYGFDHYRVGAELTRRWSMGENVAEVIENQPNHLTYLETKPDDKEQLRFQLGILLLAQDISQAYRYYWRIPESQEPYIEIKTVSSFLGLTDWEYADLKEDLVCKLTGDCSGATARSE